jgi:hypothetical protein
MFCILSLTFLSAVISIVKLDFIMTKYCRQENESSAAIRSLNQREHTLSPNMLRSFFSAIGLGDQTNPEQSCPLWTRSEAAACNSLKSCGLITSGG